MKPLSVPRCVLIVCYDFPGIRSAGVIRTYQLAKHLPSFGWQPIILTAQSCCEDQEDNIETSDGHLNCPKITAAPSRNLVPFHPDRQVQPQPPQPPNGMVPEGRGLLRRVLRFTSQLAVPDGKIGWWHTAVQAGLPVARDHPISLCFSVSPRPTSHLVARWLARSLGIPWVADFALPWSDAHWLSGRPRFLQWFDERVEASALRAAHHITVAYTDIARGICARNGTAWQKRISVIPTGFADDLFAGGRSPLPSKFTVAYPGNHFCEEGRHGECFLKAVDEWIGLNPQVKDEVEFVFIGERHGELLRQRAAMAHPEVIRIEPFISHRACIEAILSSHLCVVNTVGNRIPDKTYECMRAGKWILALSDQGSDLDHLVRSHPKGMSVDSRNIPAIIDRLQDVFQRCQSKKLEPLSSASFLQSYSSKHSAEKIAGIFDDIMLSRRPSNRWKSETQTPGKRKPNRLG